MQSSLVHVPCRSGSPHGVLGTAQALDVFAAAGGFVCAWRARENVEIIISPVSEIRTRFLMFRNSLPLTEVSVNQFFRVLDTLEFVELRIPLQPPIQWQADLP